MATPTAGDAAGPKRIGCSMSNGGTTFRLTEQTPLIISIGERGGRGENGYDKTVDLLKETRDTGNVELVWSNDPDERDELINSVTLALSAYHIENGETGRAFHANITALLDWPAVTRLHSLLGLLIEAHNRSLLPIEPSDQE